MAERWASVRRIWPSLLLIFIVMILLYTGIVTPTEVGAIGAFMAALIGAAFGRLTVSGAFESLKMTIRTCTMIFMILIGAGIFGIFMALSRVPQHVVAVVTDMNLNRWVVIIGIVIAYFIISMFMDEIPLLLITLQLTFPLITQPRIRPHLVRRHVHDDGMHGAGLPACRGGRLCGQRDDEGGPHQGLQGDQRVDDRHCHHDDAADDLSPDGHLAPGHHALNKKGILHAEVRGFPNRSLVGRSRMSWRMRPETLHQRRSPA